MEAQALLALVETTLADLKAQDLKVIDVRDKTNVTDYMVIVTGTSTRHVKAMGENVLQAAKDATGHTYSIEGEATGEWVLVDLGDVVLHVMLAETRLLYSLDKLWEATDSRRHQH